MTWKPALTVAAIVERDGRFLMVEEIVPRGRSEYLALNQPAGHVEDGEGIIEACIRETLEESGYKITPKALIGIYLWKNPKRGNTTLRFAITGDISAQPVAAELDECIQQVHWLTPDEIEDRADQLRSPLVRTAIRDHQAGQRFPLEQIQHLQAL